MKLLLAATAVALIIAGQASADPIYTNDFSAGLNGFSGSDATTTTGTGTGAGESYLGPLYNGGSASITLDTSGYSNVLLDFDIYAVQSVDGNGPAGGGPDPFVVQVNGVDVFNSNFANYNGGGNTQGFGGIDPMTGAYITTGSFAPRTGESTCNHLGYGCGDYGDATYQIRGLSLASASSLTITFFGDTNESVSGNESYGIDNVAITGTPTATGAVPEPATWATMLAGFGLVGAGMRRRAGRIVQAI